MNTAQAPKGPGPIDLRLPIDGAGVPLAYPEPGGRLALQLGLVGGGHARLVLAALDGRPFASAVVAAVRAAYQEATGAPHELSEDELAVLPPAKLYWPGLGTHFCGDGDRPAIARFHVEVDIEGECLDGGRIRAGLVEHITEAFNTVRVAVSEGFAIAGRAS